MRRSTFQIALLFPVTQFFVGYLSGQPSCYKRTKLFLFVTDLYGQQSRKFQVEFVLIKNLFSITHTYQL